MELNQYLFNDISTSGLVGILHNCDEVFGNCTKLPKSYRFPGYTKSSIASRFPSFFDEELINSP